MTIKESTQNKLLEFSIEKGFVKTNEFERMKRLDEIRRELRMLGIE